MSPVRLTRFLNWDRSLIIKFPAFLDFSDFAFDRDEWLGYRIHVHWQLVILVLDLIHLGSHALNGGINCHNLLSFSLKLLDNLLANLINILLLIVNNLSNCPVHVIVLFFE